MLQIKIDQNAINVLKNFGIFIEVEQSLKVPAQSNPEYPKVTAPPLHDPTPIIGLDPRLLQPMAIPRIPTTPVQTSVPNGGSSEFDSKGVAWNPDLHSANKTKTKDGQWRTKRNVDPELAAQVQTQASPNLPPVVVQAPPPSPFGAPPVQTAQAVIVPPTNVTVAPPMPGVHAHTFQSFKNNLVEVFAALLNEGKIDQTYIDQLKNHFQVKEIWNILASGKSCEELYDQFCSYGLIQRVEG